MVMIVNFQPEIVVFPPKRVDWFDVDEVSHDCQRIVVSLNEFYQAKNATTNEK
jgi:hypothetical protein